MFLPGESQGRGSLVGCRLRGRTELDTTEATQQQQQQQPLCPLDSMIFPHYSIQAPPKRNYAWECFCFKVLSVTGPQYGKNTNSILKSPQLKLSTRLQCHLGSFTPNSLTMETHHHFFFKKYVIAAKAQNQRIQTVKSPKGPWQSLSVIPSFYSWQNWGLRQ